MKVVERFRDITRTYRAVLGARLAGDRARPFILSHLVTSRCNADCPMCLWKKNDGDDDAKDELSTLEVENLYRQAGDLGFLHLVVWGGEPLMREDMGYLLQVAQSYGLKTTLITNGYLLPDMVDEVGPFLNNLIVSLDALSDRHDALRRLPGTFRNATDGMALMRSKYKDVKTTIISVITGDNVGHIPELLEFSRQKNLPIMFQSINTTDYGVHARPVDVSQSLPQREEEVRAFRLIRRRKNMGYPVLNSPDYINAFVSGDVAYRCHYKRLAMRVDANGDVIDCTAPGRVMANVRLKSLEDILEGPEYRTFVDKTSGCCVCMDAGTIEASYLWELRPQAIFNALRHGKNLWVN
ncbi:MAG: radical SAM protein [Planctomycetota bacterium]|jgi:MoaA/NifB/PqqE/SkfB family radical SAM enzyme